MPITDKVSRINIDQIKINREDRQRREIVTKDLQESISRIGLINPIVIDRDLVLIAGERRLEACRALGLPDILVHFVEDLSTIESKIIELEENLKRSELAWQDQVDAVAEVHRLHLELDPDWTMLKTAEAVSLTPGTISMYVRVNNEVKQAKLEAQSMELNPAKAMAIARVLEAGTIKEAHNIIMRRDARASGNAIEELLGIATGPSQVQPQAQEAQSEAILNLSFLDWAPQYSGPKFNFIHCDFPYGVEFASGPQGQGAESGAIYNDSAEVYWDLVRCLCANLPRLLSPSGHIMFWLSADFIIQAKTRELFLALAPEIEFQGKPLVWIKSDNAGISPDPRRTPRHVYETCLLGSLGKRQIVKIVGNAYSCPTDKKLHVSTKPEAMLKHFMTMLVDESTLMFDPTCGSGAALRAAESLGASSVLGLEIDPEICDRAKQALRIERLKHKAHEALVDSGIIEEV